MTVHGYQSERHAVEQFARSGTGLCTVWGPPGVGKSHLVRAAVPNAVFCSPRGQPLVVALAEALGVDGAESLAEATRAAIRARGRPVVFDGASPQDVAQWMATDPSVPVVATSRHRPHPSAGLAIHLEGLDPTSAEAFLRRYAPDASESELLRLVDRLEGLPLALELAGARLAVLTVTELLARLDDLFTALAHAPAHTRSLRAVATEAWERLETREQRVLSLLAVLEPSADLPMLERYEPNSLDALQGLIDQSLVRRVEPCGGRARYRAVVGVRELAAEHAPSASALAEAVAVRAADELSAWRHSADALARLHRDAPIYSRLASGDQPILWAAAGRAWVDGLPWRDALARLDDALRDAPLDALRGLRAEALRSGDRWEDAEKELDAVTGDGSLEWLGGPAYALLLRARLALQARRLEDAEQLASRAGGGPGEALRAAVLLMGGHLEEARTQWEHAVDVLKREGDEAWLSWSLGPMATLEEWAGHPTRSAMLQERAIALAVRRRQPMRRIAAEHARAYARLDAGHSAEALAAAFDLKQAADRSGVQKRALDAQILRADALEDLCRGEEATVLRRRLLPLARDVQRSAVGLLRIALGQSIPDDERERQTGWVLALADALDAMRQGHDPTPLLDHPGLAEGVPGVWAELIRRQPVPAEVVAHGLAHALRSVSIRAAVREADRDLAEAHRLTLWTDALDPRHRTLVAGATGLRLPGGTHIDLTRKALWGRLVDGLWDATDGLDQEALLAAGWPGEKMLPESAANRLHKTLSQMRRAGLADLLVREDDRYRLAPRITRWRVPPAGAWTGDMLRQLPS